MFTTGFLGINLFGWLYIVFSVTVISLLFAWLRMRYRRQREWDEEPYRELAAIVRTHNPVSNDPPPPEDPVAHFVRRLADEVRRRVPVQLPEEFYTAPIAALTGCYIEHCVNGEWEDPEDYLMACVWSLTRYTNAMLPWISGPPGAFVVPLSAAIGVKEYDAIRIALAEPFREFAARLYHTRYDHSVYTDDPHLQREAARIDEKYIEDVGAAAFRAGERLNRTPYNSPQAREEMSKIFSTPTPFPLDIRSRLAHEVIVAPTDHGKSQTLEHQILADLESDRPPGMVVIDSKGDMIRRLAMLGQFNPENGRLRDRLIIIDPRDAPALNLFDVKSGDADTINRLSAELAYFFRSLLGSEISTTMGGVLQPLIQLLMRVPGSNLTTFLDAVDHIETFAPYVAELPPTIRRFFERDFNQIIGKETRNAVKRRVYALTTQSPSFDLMFNARRNALDLGQALNEGKIVLVSTERNFLQDLSPVFGRYFIFKVISAALERSNATHRPPAYLYIDEAGPYIDEKTEELFSTLRSYGLGAIMAFQYFGQIPALYQRTIMANTSIKLVGGGSDEDARIFASDMRTDPEFVFRQTRDTREPPRFTRFAFFVRNSSMECAIPLTVPIGELDRRPKMPKGSYDLLRAENRRRLADLPGPVVAADPIRDSNPPVVPLVPNSPKLDEDDASTDWPKK